MAQAPARPAQPNAESLDPSVALGRRVEALRVQRPVVRTLVIVRDSRAYVDQIRRWQPGAYWPVLWDDGSPEAMEDIARFARGFEPERVVYARAPNEAADDRRAIDAALASSWNVPEGGSLADTWRTINWRPPGLVVADRSDDAWPAALALAAARGQTLAWIDAPEGRPGRMMDQPDVLALQGAIAEALDDAGVQWRTLRDDIDAITLCFTTSGRVPNQSGEGALALTDVVGRHEDGSRFAWAGWIFGSHAQSAYDAMSAVFLAQLEDVWLFDGYEASFAPPYNLTTAADLVGQAGLTPVLTSNPLNTPDGWRQRVAGGLDAELVFVNSAGRPQYFQLGGRGNNARTSDVPVLLQPAMVHFIHSFSARDPGDPRQIATRWLHHGAYAYAGAVEEPTLGAFLPSHVVLARLFRGAPWGAAVRAERDAWRLQVIGDPLATVSKSAGPSQDADVDFGAVRTATALLDEASAQRDLEQAMRMLVILRRDEDAVRLARAAANAQGDQPGMTSRLARLALGPAYRSGDAELFAELYMRLRPDLADDRELTALLWSIGRPALRAGESSATLTNLLRAHARPESITDDARALRPRISALYGEDAAKAMIMGFVNDASNNRVADQLRELAGL